MDWREKLKQMVDQASEGDWDDTDQESQVIVIPRGDEDSVFKFLSELGFNMPERDEIDTEIEKLIDAGKHVAFEDVERIH